MFLWGCLLCFLSIYGLAKQGRSRAGINHCQGLPRAEQEQSSGRREQLPGDGQGQRWHCQGMQLPPKLCPAPGTRGHLGSLGVTPWGLTISPCPALLTALIKSRRGPKPASKTCLTSARPEGQRCARALSPHQGHNPLSYSATFTCRAWPGSPRAIRQVSGGPQPVQEPDLGLNGAILLPRPGQHHPAWRITDFAVSEAICCSFVLPVCHMHAQTQSLPHTELGSDLSSAGKVQSSCLSSFILHRTRGFKVLLALLAHHTQSRFDVKKSATKLHLTKFFLCSKQSQTLMWLQ